MAEDGPGVHDFGTAHERPPPDVTGKPGGGVAAGGGRGALVGSAAAARTCMRAIIIRHTARVASLSDLSLKNRLFIATYRYRALDPVPFARAVTVRRHE